MSDSPRNSDPIKKAYSIIRDKHFKARGSTAKFLEVVCKSCDDPVILYQKDGTGRLLRCYLDRIFEPPKYAELQDKVATTDDMPNLCCMGCDEAIGVPMRHIDGRLAFRLRPGAYYKRKSDGVYWNGQF